jgi:O-antigen/teichoic acid export membrane protein
LLTLTEYGYYTLAAAVARTIFMFIGPIAQAWYPRFCELHASNNLTELAESYHKSTQLVTVTAGSAAIVVMFFSRELLMLWTQNQALADNAYIIVSVLMFGNLLNGFMTLPYQMQLAHGWTSLTMKINVVVVAAIIPLILWVTPIWGAVGAAWIWVAINGFYILVGVHFMYRRILVGQKWRWYTQDLILPLIPAAFVAVVFKFLVPATSTALVQGSIIVTVSAVTLTSATLTSRYLRSLLFHFLKIGFSSIRRI